MHGRLRVLLVLCVIALVALECTAARVRSAQQRGEAVVIGQIVDAADGRPVRQAIVRLIGNGYLRTGIADDRGRFYFRNIPAGTYDIRATKTRFLDGAFGKKRAGGASTPLVLAERQIVADAIIELFRPGSISGIVVDEGNEPVIGAQVIAYRRQYIANGWRFTAAESRLTDDEGRYRIFGLLPGDYIIGMPAMNASIPTSQLQEVAQQGRSTRELSALMLSGFFQRPELLREIDERMAHIRQPTPVPPADENGRAFTYAATYFPAADLPSFALPVTVGSGEDYIGANLQAVPVPAFRIDGEVVGPDGAGPNQMLRLLPADAPDYGFGTETAVTMSDRRGRFTFVDVPPGRYRIEAQPSISLLMRVENGQPVSLTGMPIGGTANAQTGTAPARSFDDLPIGITTVPLSKNALWAREDVSVAHEDVHGVRVELMAPVTLGGRITADGGAQRITQQELTRMEVSLEPADPFAMPLSPVRPDGSGVFVFDSVVPGQYFVRIANTPPGWHVRSAAAGGRDAMDQALEARSSTHVDVVLTKRGTQLMGTVRDALGYPVRGATVVVFPAAATSSLASSSHRTRQVRSEYSGVYTVAGLPPGEYVIAAMDESRSEGWQDGSRLTELRAGAGRVTLRDGETRSLDIRFQPRK